ncbi:hypothetical protein ACFVTF_06595 [Kitasatospora sp. NPDC057940]|uniref:hypothetical protein n=1 Tax=Kitasatospora sp. NPDC057940 TaxID=3346285 RepID=UPI0036DAF70F
MRRMEHPSELFEVGQEIDVAGFPHLSELTGEPAETPDLLVDEGELITVKVAEVDLQRHRVRQRAAGGADTSHDWSQEA